MKRIDQYLHRPWRAGSLVAALAVGALGASVAVAEPVTFTRVEQNVDWTSAGISGVGGGSGTINLTGVSGPVLRAFLFWHGIDNSGSGQVYDNETITLNGSSVTGVAIGDATTNCWGTGSSRAFRADVTALVAGDGSFVLSGLSNGAGHSANGAVLVVTYDDGISTNNRDLAFFEGNDSNIPDGFPGEDNGWNAMLSPISYNGGTVSAQLLVADGQSFTDGPLTFMTPNGSFLLSDSSSLYDGNSIASAGTSRASNGELFDVHDVDITSAFGGVTGPVTLNVNGVENTSDCLGLLVLLLDLEPFSAPSPGIALLPAVDFNLLGDTHDVLALLATEDGVPIADTQVTFTVLNGPNAGDTAVDLSDAAGEANFSYPGDGGVGLDQIQGLITVDSQVFTDTALKFWDNDCNENDIPDACDVSCDTYDDACGVFAGCGMSADDNMDGVPDECAAGPIPCDIDANGLVDITDIQAIAARRNTPANGPDDPADVDGDGIITLNDARQCVLMCTNERCAP